MYYMCERILRITVVDPQLFGSCCTKSRQIVSSHYVIEHTYWHIVLMPLALTKVNLHIFKHTLLKSVAPFITIFDTASFIKRLVISSRLKKKTSMVPFSPDNNGLGRRHSGENFIRPLYIVKVSPPTYYVTLRETEEKYPGISRETYAPLVSR